jgi:menaquinone-dependent protoporphyrinogen oxidase
MAAVLILYSTVDGHTRKICERLAQLIEASGHRCTLVAIEDARELELAAYDKVVVGASIRYGRHRRSVFEFANANARLLDRKRNAFFSVNVVARKPQRDQPQTNPYVRKFLLHSRWQPKVLDVFAGKLDYPRYGFVDRLVIRFIMWLTHGPTDPTAVVEFTDWQRVDAFAARIAAM